MQVFKSFLLFRFNQTIYIFLVKMLNSKFNSKKTIEKIEMIVNPKRVRVFVLSKPVTYNVIVAFL